MLNNVYQTVTTDPNKLEDQAKEALPRKSYNYVAGGAGERATMDANRLAFRCWKVCFTESQPPFRSLLESILLIFPFPMLYISKHKAHILNPPPSPQIIPRMLRPTSTRDLRVTLFNKTYDTPLVIAPVGVQGIFHADKETGMASVATDLGIPYIMSTASSSTIEEVASASGPTGDRWFQLYWPQDDEITISLLSRAQKAGFTVLVVTLDTWALAWRPWDLDGAFVPFFQGTGNAVGFSDEVFRRKFREGHPEGKEIEEDVTAASERWIAAAWSGAAHSWEQLEVLKRNWEGPIVLKGIQHPDDARRAVECGMDGIVVSNHGGRQLDGAVGSLDMLPEIVEAVGDKCTVLFDSGIRTGTDVIKALCLGAKGVLIGRPWVYGLGIAGREGAKQVMKGLLADLDQSMGLAGIQSVKDCSPKMVRRIQYPGDRHSSY
jgi:lactate 2-monooxygenase